MRLDGDKASKVELTLIEVQMLSGEAGLRWRTRWARSAKADPKARAKIVGWMLFYEARVIKHTSYLNNKFNIAGDVSVDKYGNCRLKFGIETILHMMKFFDKWISKISNNEKVVYLYILPMT